MKPSSSTSPSFPSSSYIFYIYIYFNFRFRLEAWVWRRTWSWRRSKGSSRRWGRWREGLSPGRMRSDGPGRNASTAVAGLLPTRRWKGLLRQQAVADLAMPRSGSLMPVGEALAPLIEGPDPGDSGDPRREGVGWGQWMKGQLSRAPSVSAASASASCPRSDLRLILGVMGAPLAPIHVCSTDPLPHLSIKGTTIVGRAGLARMPCHA